MKKAFLIVAVMLFAVIAFSLFKESPLTQTSIERPVVTVSTFALYDIVRHVAEDKVDLFMIVPFGVDVHSFEPTPRELAKLSKSALFIYSGAGLEPWAETFSKSVKTVDISQHVKLLHLEEVDPDDDQHDMHHGDHHHAERVDPHYWLDMENMILATRNIEKALGEVVPNADSLFHRNAEAYITQLHMIDDRYKNRLSACKQSRIIVNHNAFGYLARRYGFEITALSGLSPEAMPSAKTMAKLTDLVKSHKIKTIFFESFVSDRLIKNIAKESGAGVDVLQPLANITADEAAQEQNFEQLMGRNLNKLSTAMECL